MDHIKVERVKARASIIWHCPTCGKRLAADAEATIDYRVVNTVRAWAQLVTASRRQDADGMPLSDIDHRWNHRCAPDDIALPMRTVSAGRAARPPAINAAHLRHQRNWSTAIFGPGARLKGVLAHIRKELAEVEAAPHDLEEWADLIILSFDGALRSGADPQSIIDAVKAKQAKNEARTWPDWRASSEDDPIEHVR